MDTIKKLTNELAIAGQLTSTDLKQVAAEGYQSVVNLRSPSEPGLLKNEQQCTELLGLRYINFPIPVKSLSLEAVLPISQQLARLPKPILLHCDTGIRASIIAMMYVAVVKGMSVEATFQKVVQLGLLGD